MVVIRSQFLIIDYPLIKIQPSLALLPFKTTSNA